MILVRGSSGDLTTSRRKFYEHVQTEVSLAFSAGLCNLSDRAPRDGQAWSESRTPLMDEYFPIQLSCSWPIKAVIFRLGLNTKLLADISRVTPDSLRGKSSSSFHFSVTIAPNLEVPNLIQSVCIIVSKLTASTLRFPPLVRQREKQLTYPLQDQGNRTTLPSGG